MKIMYKIILFNEFYEVAAQMPPSGIYEPGPG